MADNPVISVEYLNAKSMISADRNSLEGELGLTEPHAWVHLHTKVEALRMVWRSKLLRRGVVHVAALFAFFTIFPFLWMVITTFKSRGAIFTLPPELYPDLLFQEGMWDSYVRY